MSRLYFGLDELETPTKEGGVLTIKVEDALSPTATVEGGFAGILAYSLPSRGFVYGLPFFISSFMGPPLLFICYIIGMWLQESLWTFSGKEKFYLNLERQVTSS